MCVSLCECLQVPELLRLRAFRGGSLQIRDIHCTLFVIRVDLHYSLLTSGLPQPRARRTLQPTNRNTKCPYPSTLTLSHLLHQHALRHMSSDGNNDLALEYTAGAVADSPVPLSQEYPVDTPVRIPIPIVNFTTLQPLSDAATIYSPRPVSASSSASDVAAMF
jgi:hypothetical protein